MLSHNSYIPANMFRAHEGVSQDIDKLVTLCAFWRQVLEGGRIVGGWQSATVPGMISLAAYSTEQPYEVLYGAVKGKHRSEKTHWCSWQAVPLRVQEILSSWLKRVMSRGVPHSVLVFYCPTESCDSSEGSASFKRYFMFHMSMSSLHALTPLHPDISLYRHLCSGPLCCWRRFSFL